MLSPLGPALCKVKRGEGKKESDVPLRDTFYGLPSAFILFNKKTIWLILTPAQFPADSSGLGVLNWHKSWVLCCPFGTTAMKQNYHELLVLHCPKHIPRCIFLSMSLLWGSTSPFHHPFSITLSMPSYSYTKGVLHLDHIHLLQAFNRSHLHKKCGFQVHWYTFIATCFIG